MVDSVDPRLISLGIEVNGKLNIYKSLNIKASGVKYANANQDECDITISNLTENTRNYILTETSPYNLDAKPKRAYLYAGRQSYGTSLIFVGDIVLAHASQPPDISVTIKCLSLNFLKSKVISTHFSAKTALSEIAAETAKELGVGLTFEATDRQISNYSYSGSAIKQVGVLGTAVNVDAYVTNGMLVVKNIKAPLTGRLRVLDVESGMVGVPEFTQSGIKVKYLLDNFSEVGGALKITSKINPSINGTYAIYKLGFDIANRDTPFYWIAEAARLKV